MEEEEEEAPLYGQQVVEEVEGKHILRNMLLTEIEEEK